MDYSNLPDLVQEESESEQASLSVSVSASATKDQDEHDQAQVQVQTQDTVEDEDHQILTNTIKSKPRQLGNVFEFTDFGWEDAFEDDGEEEFGIRADLDSEIDRTSMMMDGLSVEGRQSSSGRNSLYQRLRISRPGSKQSSYGKAIGSDDETVFRPGERFGSGLPLRGEVVEHVDPTTRLQASGRSLPINGVPASPAPSSTFNNKVFEVVRKLGSGSYANVYLVREVGGVGQEYALKCLSKQDLEQDSLDVQLFEATIHLCLPKHENIVTLYQTLQTRKWLFLLMEMCPGEDLFYWLEHSKDSPPESTYGDDAMSAISDDRHVPLSSSQLPSSAIPYSSSAIISGMGASSSSLALSQSPAFAFSKSHLSHELYGNGQAGTPTTPSLLSAYSAKALLSTRRLKLIASMFGQMCEAVALCHDVGISHRDIKPENFICCDSEELAAIRDDDEITRYEKRKVIVKLTDFGLATTEENSCDVECGSRPYMAYECRNELGPSYAPKPADVWSLGVVLLNMLFHRNPWTDPTPGNNNFDGFLDDPTDFLLTRFTGIGREVATYLAQKVFTLGNEERVDAREFGVWSRDLPIMIGGRKAVSALRLHHLNNGPGGKDSLDFTKNPIHAKGMQLGLSGTASNLTHSMPIQPNNNNHRQHAIGGGHGEEEAQDLPEILVHPTSQVPSPKTRELTLDIEEVSESQENGEELCLSVGGVKRKKRGARKGKSAKAAAKALLEGVDMSKPSLPTPIATAKDDLLSELAQASEHLAREVSQVNKSKDDFVVDLDEFPKIGEQAPAEVKKSKWKNLISLSSGNPELQALAKKVQEKNVAFNQSAPARLQQPTRSTISGSMQHTPNLSYTSTMSQTNSFNLSPPSLSRPLDSDNWRAKDSEARGKEAMPQIEELAYNRSDMMPHAPSLVNSLMTPSMYGTLHTVPAHASTISANRPVQLIDTRTKGSSYQSKNLPKSNANSMVGTPWEIEFQPQQTPTDRHGSASIEESSMSNNTAFSQITHTSSKTSQHYSDNSLKSSSHLANNHSSNPPPKLKMQIRSLGKILGGLKRE